MKKNSARGAASPAAAKSSGASKFVGKQTKRVRDPDPSFIPGMTSGDFEESKIPLRTESNEGSICGATLSGGSVSEVVAPSDSCLTDSQAGTLGRQGTKTVSSSKRKSSARATVGKSGSNKIGTTEVKNLNANVNRPVNSNIKLSVDESNNQSVTLVGARSTMKPIVAALPVESIRNLHNKRSKEAFGSAAISKVVVTKENFSEFVLTLKNLTTVTAAARRGWSSAPTSLVNRGSARWIANALEAAVNHAAEHHVYLDVEGLEAAALQGLRYGGKAMDKVGKGLKQLWLLVNFTRMHAADGEFPDIILHNHFSCGESAKGSEQIACTCMGEGIIVDLPLLAYLRTYTVFRSRDRNLMATCLARCKTYQREYSVSDHCMARVMPGTVMVAYIQSPEEGNALAMANSLQFEATTRQFGQTIRRSPYSGYLEAWWQNGWSGLHSQYHGSVAVVGRQ